jgi:hypothetical protein
LEAAERADRYDGRTAYVPVPGNLPDEGHKVPYKHVFDNKGVKLENRDGCRTFLYVPLPRLVALALPRLVALDCVCLYGIGMSWIPLDDPRCDWKVLESVSRICISLELAVER